MEDIGSIDQLQGFTDIVIGDQNTNTAILEVGHESSYFSDCDRIDPGEGLIEQYKVRSRGQCPRDLNPAPLAAGKRRGRSFPQMGDCELLEQGFEIAFAALACRLDQFEHGANVLLDGQAAENGGFLRQITDAQP